MKKAVKTTVVCSIKSTVVATVGWAIFLGGFGVANSPTPSSALASIPFYFTAVVFPVLAILLIGAAIQLLAAPSYKIIQALLMPFIIIFAITAAVHGGTILNALALSMAVGTPATDAANMIFAGIVIELAGLVVSLFLLIISNIYLRD